MLTTEERMTARLPPKGRPLAFLFYLAVALFAGVYLGSFQSSLYQRSRRDSSMDEKAERSLLVEQELKRLQSNLSDLTEELNELRASNATSEELRCNTTEMTGTAMSDIRPEQIQRPQQQHPICQSLPFPTPTADALWSQNLEHILRNSRLMPNDPRFYFHDFTAQLLHITSPRLSRSIQTLGTDWTTVRHLLDLAHARWQHVRHGGPSARPLRILVLGGSVLVGRNCRRLVKDLGLQISMPQRECTWSHRLQVFLNEFFGENVVEVTKIAMGGTNTAVGSIILEYDLIPPEAKNPDIIINAYSTNDMHILTALEAQSSNQTLREKVFDMTQDFVRIVLKRQPCQNHRPLLIHVDDYLGNEQREIMATTELSQGVRVLASYYGFVSLSYSNVVRDLVYGDTREEWFSPDGWWPNKATKMEREIHPGMGMHITTAWLVAYNLLHIVTTYCSLEVWNLASDEGLNLKEFDYNTSAVAKVAPLRGSWHKAVPGRPKVPPLGLPPLLMLQLSLEDVSEQWRKTTKQEDELLKTVDCESRDEAYNKCIFSWVSGLSQHQNDQTWIEGYLGARIQRLDGWKLSGDNGKLGYAPSTAGDTIVLDFVKLVQPVQRVTFFMLRSYGPRFEGSRLRVDTEYQASGSNSNWSNLTSSHEFVGFHAKNTSEMYTELIALPRSVEVGGSLRVRSTFIGANGTTFKIMGLAVCS